MKITSKVTILIYFLCMAQDTRAQEHEVQVPAEVVEQLVNLRKAQQQAWGYDFFTIERTIERLKQRYNKVYIPDSYAWVQAVPLMGKQILFLALWWIIVFCVKLIITLRRGRTILLCLVLLTVGATALSVKKQERAVVRCTTSLYIGPDRSYPVKTALYPLDELTLIKQVASWYYTTTPERGWVQAEALIKL